MHALCPASEALTLCSFWFRKEVVHDIRAHGGCFPFLIYPSPQIIAFSHSSPPLPLWHSHILLLSLNFPLLIPEQSTSNNLTHLRSPLATDATHSHIKPTSQPFLTIYIWSDFPPTKTLLLPSYIRVSSQPWSTLATVQTPLSTFAPHPSHIVLKCCPPHSVVLLYLRTHRKLLKKLQDLVLGDVHFKLGMCTCQVFFVVLLITRGREEGKERGNSKRW